MRKDFFNESFVLVSLGTLLETIFPGFRNFKFKRTKRAIGDRSFDIHFIMKARGSKYREIIVLAWEIVLRIFCLFKVYF